MILIALIAVILLFVVIQKVVGGKGESGGDDVSLEPSEEVAMSESEGKTDLAALAEVVVVKQDVPARTTITPEMLEVQKVPSQYIHPMAITKYEEALDMISLVPINAGEQLIQTKVADAETNYLSYKLKEGHVGFTVPVTELTAAAGMLRVGDEVHVLGNFTSDVAGKDLTKFILSDLKILAIGKDMAINAMANEDSGFSNMTLEVTPEQATQLSWAAEQGSLTYILKSVLNKEDLEDMEIAEAKMFFGDIENFADKEYKDAIQKVIELRELEATLKDLNPEDLENIRHELDYTRYEMKHKTQTNNPTENSEPKKEESTEETK